MRPVVFALLFALALAGHEAETFALSSILPWNWPIFHRAPNSTIPIPKEGAMKTEASSPSPDPAPAPQPLQPSNAAPKDTKVKRELIYEYDGYD